MTCSMVDDEVERGIGSMQSATNTMARASRALAVITATVTLPVAQAEASLKLHVPI
jgi:hypothetical protein